MNTEIQYTDTISKEEFEEFKTVLKELDPKDYETEAKDNFVDCYNYWVKLGYRRFMDKHRSNVARLEAKKTN